MPMKQLISFLIFFLVFQVGFGQELITYKSLPDGDLFLEVHTPENIDTSKLHSGMVFFFGGGWNGGSRDQFAEHAKYFSQRGMVCFLADYRTKKSHGTSPFQSVEDAKSAMRYIRENASAFHLDPDKIIASGGSAGGHLAAATAMVEDYNDETDNLTISCKPNALILFNPVIDNGPGGYGYKRIGSAYKAFSPLHNIKKGAPPTIIFLGSNDKLIPVTTVEYYKVVMDKVGSRCEVNIYDGKGHGFFNYKIFDMYEKTVSAADHFLVSLELLDVEPKVTIE